jgi:hypothetical protein
MNTLRSGGPILAFLLSAIAAAMVPLIDKTEGAARTAGNGFRGWPTHYEGRLLTELPLTQRETAFTRDFPGRVGRFSDGSREIIIRWVNAPTRRLHSAADCLRSSGYSTTPLPAGRDATGAAMGCFHARQRADDLTICEVIRDERGETWPDVSAWYWNALLGSSPGPWWSFVVAERN